MLIDILAAMIVTFVQFAVVIGALTALEYAFPRERQSVRSRLQGAVFWVIYTPINAFVIVVFIAMWRRLGIDPLVVLDFPLHGLVAIFVAATLGDFAFYWMHRFEHAFLWRFHAVHHSVRELNAAGSYHHIVEPIVRAFFISLPGALIVQDYAHAGWLAFILIAQGNYLHSSTRLHLGPLRYLIGDNHFHRIHHSTDPAHYGRNFSAFAPIWDIAFGTAYFPKRDEWPKAGLDEVEEPATVRDYVLQPFNWPRPVTSPSTG